MSYACPICKTELEPNPRYKRYVCPDCAARYADTEAPYDNHQEANGKWYRSRP